MRSVVLAVLAAGNLVSVTGAADYRDVRLAEGQTLRYAIVLPHDFDPSRTYPALLALPPGPQTERMVEAGLSRYWGEQAASRGWIVVSPVAPDGKLFFRGAETHIPALLDAIGREYSIEGGRFHLAGSSNGGRAAFRVATLFPDRFHSLTVLPGYPPDAVDRARLGALRGKPVTMFAGEDDDLWVEKSEEVLAELIDLGIEATLTLLPGEGHVPPSLDGTVMIERLERVRASTVDAADPSASKVTAIARILDDFHDAAAKADGDRYFAHFAPDGIFIGTDASERWTVAEFRRYADPHFSRGRGWEYVPTTRQIAVRAGDPSVAWFHELLDNAKYGVCRGTGTMLETNEGWKIAQYTLSIPIPNDKSLGVVELIRAE